MAKVSTNPAAILMNHLGVDGMAKNIWKIYEETCDLSYDLYLAGRDWYANSQELAMAATVGSKVTACGVVAALSPQTSWAQNVKNASTFWETGTAPTLGASIAKADRIRHGVHPLNVLGGNKVRSFYCNLVDPEDNRFVTVDRHAVAIALGGKVAKADKALELAGGYEMVQNAYIKVANDLGSVANSVQAITWLGWRTVHATGYSKQDMEL